MGFQLHPQQMNLKCRKSLYQDSAVLTCKQKCYWK